MDISQKFRIHKIHRLHEAQEGSQSVGALILLRKGNKILREAYTEKTGGAESEGTAIQRLSHLGIHLIYNHKAQTLLWMLTRS
jgi:pyrimidine deaminase RibD-like protein